MAKTPIPPKGETKYLRGMPPEREEEPPMTREQARRELGFDLLPFNGGDREDFQD